MKRLFSIISLILILSMMSSALLPLSALTPDTKIAATDLDFSDPSRYECEEISPTELLSLILPESAISDEEARYLSTCTDSFLLINKTFSNERVSLHFNGTDSISVAARPYEYTAANGYAIKWIPVSAHYLDESATLTRDANGEYVAELPAVRTDDTVFVSVDYTCSITLSAAVLDFILNRTYRDAQAAKAENLEYEKVLAAYTEKYRAYTEYLAALDQYEDDRAAYEKYLKLKAEYEADLAEYNKYLSKLAKYETELAAYNQYLRDLEKYEADKAEYDRVYAENQGALNDYLEYYKKLNKIKSTMYAMESIYTKHDDGKNALFNALQNKELVATFERYKDILSYFGVSTDTVDRLSAESDDLNDLLIEYSEIRQVSDQAAFEFYVKNYDEICYKFNHLYDAMIEIMSPGIYLKMCAKIDLDYKDDPEMGAYKKGRILNVISQIYLVSRCLDDEQSTDGTWSFYTVDKKGKVHEYTYSFHELLAPNVIISDTNDASPEGLVWPDEVPPVVLPPVPQPPREVAKPLAPTVVENPTSPTPVTEPTPPTAVAHPGAAPTRPEGLSVYDEIVSLLECGELTERAINANGETITLRQSIDKLVAFDNPAIISVYGDDRSTPLQQYTAEYNSVLTPPSITLQRAPTEKYVYTFEGWSLSPDAYLPIEDYVIERDISIYAYFSRADRLYDITWITAQGTSTVQLKYGDTPSFAGDASKPSTDYTVYSFEGWSPTIKKVTEHATYTAQYSGADRKYTVTWSYPGKTVTELCNFGQMPTEPTVPQKYIEGTTLFSFVGWSETPTATRGDKTYTALYEEITLTAGEAESGATLTESTSAFDVITAGNTLTVHELLKHASSESKKINIKFGDTTLAIDKTAVAALAKSGAYRISLVTDPATRSAGEITSLSLLITDASGNTVRLSKGEIRITVPTTREDVTNYTLYAIRDGGARERLSYSHSDGEISFIAKPNQSFKFIQLYTVTIQTAENGETALDTLAYEAGSTVKPYYYPAITFELAEVSIIRADNKQIIPLEDVTSFVMPDSDVTLVVSYRKLSFMIRFVVNGEEVLSGRYEMGAIPTPPEVPQEYTEGEYRFVFAGWSPRIEGATADTTYVAKYNSFLGPKTTIEQVNALEAIAKHTVLPAVAICVAAVAVLMLLIVVLNNSKRKKKKKLKKAKKPESNN